MASRPASQSVISLVMGSIFFALSGLKIRPKLNQWLMRHTRLWLLAFLAFWLTYNWVFLVTIPALSAGQTVNHTHTVST